MSSKRTSSAAGALVAPAAVVAPAAPEPAPSGELRKTSLVKTAINTCLEEGMTDKQALYTKVVEELGVPRPSVRRIAHDMRLRNELLDKVNVLRASVEAKPVAPA